MTFTVGVMLADLIYGRTTRRLYTLFTLDGTEGLGEEINHLSKNEVPKSETLLSASQSKTQLAKEYRSDTDQDIGPSRLRHIQYSRISDTKPKYLELSENNFRDSTSGLNKINLNNHFVSLKAINDSKSSLLAYSKYSRWDLRSSVSAIESKPVNNYKSLVDDFGHAKSYTVKNIATEKKLNNILVRNFNENHSNLLRDPNLLNDQVRLSNNLSKLNTITGSFEWLNKSSFILVTDKPSLQQPYSNVSTVNTNSQSIPEGVKLSDFNALLVLTSLDLSSNLNSIYIPTQHNLQLTRSELATYDGLNSDYLVGTTKLSNHQFFYLGVVLYTTTPSTTTELYTTANFSNSVNHYQ